MARDYYLVLGVSRSADLNRIKKAYRQVAKKYHPDVTHTSQSAKKFREVREAYETLSDEGKRKQHDRELERRDHRSIRGGKNRINAEPPVYKRETDLFSHLDDWFSGFVPGWFDTGRGVKKDLYCEIILSPSEASQGGLFPLTVPVVKDCPRCTGSGAGRSLFCSRCYGSGKVEEKREFSVSVPPRVKHGTEVSLSLEDIGLQNVQLHIAVFVDSRSEAFWW
jgi:molecular chaperone DnaJ